MPVTLKQPKQSEVLDKIRIASFKVEDNPYRNQYWIEIWCVLGRMQGDQFLEYQDPNTGEPAVYFKIENGKNPLSPDQALGKCADCGTWHSKASGNCEVDGCSGVILGYDGFTRLALGTPSELATFRALIANGLYDFLVNESIPDPITGVERKLIEAE